MKLDQLVYISTAVRELSDQDLLNLLSDSRRRNQKYDISGFLLYYNRSFLQVIEGRHEAISRLYSSLEADSRHRGVTTLMHRDIHERLFADWSMAFRRFDKTEVYPVPGFSAFMENAQHGPSDLPPESEVTAMIESFKVFCLAGS